MARALSNGRPQNSRWLVLFASLFAVQAGATVVQALAILSLWAIAAYLASLLSASVSVAREASAWLRATPMRFVAFAWPLARRALLHQVAGAIVVAAGIVAVGAPLALALYFASVWLALVVAVSAIALSESYRACSPGWRIAFSLATMASLEARTAAWSIPAAALIAAWHIRRGVKT